MTSLTLVGRASPLARLVERAERAADGKGSTVVVSGEAGIGKTRLVTELVSSLPAGAVAVAIGHSVAVGEEPLRHAALLEVAGSLGTTIGAGGAGGTSGTNLAGVATDALLELLVAQIDVVAAERPCLLIIEDVHWADRATCEVLMVLARRLAGRRVLLVITVRDDELARTHPVRGFLAELSRAQQVGLVSLNRLGAGEVALLIDHLLGPCDPVRASAIFRRSGGNPLLVEELSAAGADGGPALLTDSSELRLLDVLLARADRLPPEALDVAAAVAVGGNAVDESTLTELLATDEARRKGLRAALDGHLLERTGTLIGFHHALVGDAVRSRLLWDERRDLHRRWAEVLSRSGTDKAVLAHHWDEAGLVDEALAAAVASGDETLVAIAPEDAERQYRRAIELWDLAADPETCAGCSRVELFRRAAAAASWAGEPGRAAELITSVLDDPSVAADRLLTSVLHERRAWYRMRRGDNNGAAVGYRQAFDALPADAPPAARAPVLAGCVRMWERAGQAAAALAVAHEAVAEAVRATEAGSGSDSLEATTRNMLGRALILSGDRAGAITAFEESAVAAERCGDTILLTSALVDRAELMATVGKLDQVPAEIDAVRARLADRGLTHPHGVLVHSIGVGVRRRLGDPRFRAEAEAVAEAGRSRITLALGHVLVGTADLDGTDLARPDPTAAREHLESARFLIAPLLDARLSGSLALARAELALAEDRLGAARAAVAEGVDVVERLFDFELLAHLCLMGLRVASERSRAAPARGSTRAEVRDREDVARYEQLLERFVVGRSDRPVEGAVAAAWQCERSRLDGRSDPDAWHESARRWESLSWARPAVLARIRAAEGELGDPRRRRRAADGLGELHERALAIGSRLLADQVRDIARRAGADQTFSGPTVPASSTSARGAAGAAASVFTAAARPTIDLRDSQPATPLTRREREVLDLVVAGATNRQIADALYISTKTASVHVSRILTKLGAGSRQEAATMARRGEWV